MSSASELALVDLNRAQTSGYEEDTQNSLFRRGFRASELDRGQSSVNLPQADRGRRAWLFLAGSFMVECLIWGFPFSYGKYNSEWFFSPTEAFVSNFARKQ